MSDRTPISWTDATWNPTRGCTRVSAGCEHCYAERQARRQDRPGGAYEGLTTSGPKGPRWSGKIRLVPEALRKPLRWRKPRRIFVDSMSDLFHEDIPDDYIAAVFGVMARCSKHTFQVLTKRPERMRAWFESMTYFDVEAVRPPLMQPAGTLRLPTDPLTSCEIMAGRQGVRFPPYIAGEISHAWPLPNIWLGVSCEDQAAADERIPLLLQTPAAVKFVSAEPLLGPIDFAGRSLVQDGQTTGWSLFGPPYGGLSWIIVGGESGPGARPCRVEWIRSIVEQCRKEQATCWVKQLGARPVLDEETEFADWLFGRLRSRKGDDPSEWPEDLRGVQEFPA